MAAKNLLQPLLSSNISTIDRLVIDGHRSDEEAVQMVNGMLSTFGPSLSGVTYLNLMAAGRRNLVVPILSLQDCTNLRTLHIQSIYLGSSYNIGPEFLSTVIRTVQNIIYSVPKPELLEEIRIRFEVDIHKADVAADTVATPTAVPTLDSAVPSSQDYAPFIDQLKHVDWTKFAQFLLDIPFPVGLNPSPLSKSHPRATSWFDHQVRNAKQGFQQRIHIQLGSYGYYDKIDSFFQQEYNNYVDYILTHGMKNIVEQGLELVFSRDEDEDDNLYYM
ncbi:hypothetical protein FB446DRAFT_818631 [Lentinula raphanica]|nr:hypothetical protein FB446DRAFT_818631 [Lentinula raphanica]